MRAVHGILLSLVIASVRAQTLPPVPPDPPMQEVGRHFEAAGTLRQYGTISLVAGGLIAGAVAMNLEDNQRGQNLGYTVAGILCAVGVSLNIAGNAHEIKAGKLMRP